MLLSCGVLELRASAGGSGWSEWAVETNGGQWSVTAREANVSTGDNTIVTIDDIVAHGVAARRVEAGVEEVTGQRAANSTTLDATWHHRVEARFVQGMVMLWDRNGFV